MENELSQMILRYDDIMESNNLMSSQVKEAKRNAELTLDSLRILRSDLSVISKFKHQLTLLKTRNDHLFKAIDSLKDANLLLQREKLLAYNALKKERSTNNSLKKENEILSEHIKKGALLTANSFEARAYKSFLGRKKETRRATKADHIEVNFTLAQNALAEEGEKELYIQIVNPNNNVMADKGSTTFGDSSLIYSSRKTVNYRGDVMDITVDIEPNNNEKPLSKGTYFVNVFHKDRKLGATQVTLQ
ncbi:hypothetical protein [Mangrovimonas sp. TPBH4]|uniref:hypothetical protein n=1 Tax=Mangrovimonas sp. TPBH4 TaxID=1645914 RepID=UPI0012FCD9BB|nr:hypothetical protein [Mangrovimonas sp. TPBH4]